jgi:hypothetical protein
MTTLRMGAQRRHPELERLICAAISNEHFATQLVTTPELALTRSEYCRNLSPAERALVASVNGAADIYDFAARLLARVQQRN